mmetsp:Transcript_43258/g.129771  ORF Transcript_43258/g.129771 Transcript_43258/m.129771 type:complete len:84 (-) Transcript_43258:220-471(-)
MSHRQPQGLMGRLKNNKVMIAGGIVATLCTMAYIPIWYHVNFIPKHNMQDPIPRSASMRGAYLNTGSRDIGPETETKRTPTQM